MSAVEQEISLDWVLSTLDKALGKNDRIEGTLDILQFREDLEKLVRVKHVSAREATVAQIELYFGIKYDWVNAATRPLLLTKTCYKFSKMDCQRLHDYALLEPSCDGTERTCRFLMNHFIMNAKLQLYEKFNKSGTSSPCHEIVYSNISNLQILVDDPFTLEKVRFSGRLYHTWGYRDHPNRINSLFLVAVEAKKHSLFSAAESELLAYLAILHEKKKRAGEKSSLIQGFYTDGNRYAFMAIRDNGTVEASDVFQALNPTGRDMIFNFIMSIQDTAIQARPTVTPVKKTKQHLDNEGWQHLSGVREHDDSDVEIDAEDLDGSESSSDST